LFDDSVIHNFTLTFSASFSIDRERQRIVRDRGKREKLRPGSIERFDLRACDKPNPGTNARVANEATRFIERTKRTKRTNRMNRHLRDATVGDVQILDERYPIAIWILPPANARCSRPGAPHRIAARHHLLARGSEDRVRRSHHH
jgi:hypothetical protein